MMLQQQLLLLGDEFVVIAVIRSCYELQVDMNV